MCLDILPIDMVNCSYLNLLKRLNMTKNKELFTMARPVENHTNPTVVYLQMAIYGILDVREVDQTFIAYIWVYLRWINEHIRWHPNKFCGIQQIVIPAEVLWKPDVMIEEMTEKDKAPPSPYLTVSHEGGVEFRNDIMLISTCKMQIYKFPFDVQSCSLSFKSAVYSDKELLFEAILDSSMMTGWSRDMTQYEWLFINITAINTTVDNFIYNQSMIVYTIKMRRRPLLYIANFLVPILFFFSLDLASFLISDRGGEKLSFKVTVLLAVTVMQLILNEILPSSSDSIPLIAIYCIGMFGLIMLSLLETILVMYLIEKDFASEDNEANKGQIMSEECEDKQGNYDGEVKKWTHCSCVCDVSADEPPSDLLSVKEDKSSQLTEESNALEKLSDELGDAVKTLSLLLNSRKEARKPNYWTEVAKTIDKVFFVVYVTVAGLFLAVIFTVWINANDE
ncbi:5-hydroxytryptamine receptor 3A-like [Cottoperca gobio]|uniref:5-hydroxytryptamine receptor 3A-like n=1 Tax=Cottoperca gobio TaxID=56716 RepID=A0A6J2RNR0_COTGO|nr:5-hydroxytryptamine receptor 3A-like [Cottoperca gobio]